MSARTSDSPDFWRAKLKGCTPANTLLWGCYLHKYTKSILFLPFVDTFARADTICLKSLQRFLQARLCAAYQVTDGQTGAFCFSSYISATFLTKLVAKGW